MQSTEQGRHFVITMVHGTWAPGAPWTQPGSKIRLELDQHLHARGASRVEFCRFDWSGANSYHDRRCASTALRRQLYQQFLKTPYAIHAIVAHSHGANVGLRAVLRSRYLRSRFGGVIAIATPFLKFEEQDLALLLSPIVLTNAYTTVFKRYRLREILWGLAPFLLAYGVFWLINLGYWQTKLDDLLTSACACVFPKQVCGPIGTSLIVLWCIFMAARYSMAALSESRKRMLKRNSVRFARERKQILARFAYFQPRHYLTTPPIFALSSPIDEALAVLAGSWWIHRASWLFGWVLRVTAVSIGVLIFGAALYCGWALSQHFRTERAGWLLVSKFWYPFATIVVALPLLMLMAYLVRWLGSIVGRSSPGLGLSNPRHNLLWRVKACRVPELLPHDTFRRYTVRELIRESRGILFHSRIYTFGPAIEEMAAWIDGLRKGERSHFSN